MRSEPVFVFQGHTEKQHFTSVSKHKNTITFFKPNHIFDMFGPYSCTGMIMTWYSLTLYCIWFAKGYTNACGDFWEIQSLENNCICFL